MLKKLGIKVNTELNISTLISGALIFGSLLWFGHNHFAAVEDNTQQIKEHKKLIADIFENAKEAAKERKGQAIAMADMARLVGEIRRLLDNR